MSIDKLSVLLYFNITCGGEQKLYSQQFKEALWSNLKSQKTHDQIKDTVEKPVIKGESLIFDEIDYADESLTHKS